MLGPDSRSSAMRIAFANEWLAPYPGGGFAVSPTDSALPTGVARGGGSLTISGVNPLRLAVRAFNWYGDGSPPPVVAGSSGPRALCTKSGEGVGE